MDRTQMISDYINSVYQSIEEETAQPAAPIGGGLAAKPVKPTVKDDDTEDKRGVLSRLYDTMSSYFKSDDDDDVSAITTSPTTLNNAAKEATLNNASIVDIIKANKDTPTGSAVINIPLSRLQKPEVQFDEQKILDRFVTTPPDRPDATTVAPLAPGGEALSDGKVDEGLMSKPIDAEVSTYSTITSAVYTDFYDNREEGNVAHVGQDSQNLTLPAGVVADGGVTYDGTEVKAGKNTVKSSEFDVSKVDMSKAYKKVGGKTYKREDYASDEDWSKALIEAFKDVVKNGAGSSWDNLTDSTKQAVTKLSWNNGEGWAKYETSKALYKELAKKTKDKKIIADGILNYSTVVNGGASIGIAKARANAWNKMSDAHGFAEINKITADNTGVKTKFNYYDKQGNLVHTETTSRAPAKYSSTSTEVEKDATGVW